MIATDSLQQALTPVDDATHAPEPAFAAGGTDLLATRERIPPGLLAQLRAAHRLDGYLVGAGCGTLALLDAFAAAPLGVIVADRDPAVVLAARQLVAALARHADAESWVAALFLPAAAPRPASEPLAEAADRVRRSFAAAATAAAPDTPTVQRLLAAWQRAGALPDTGEPSPAPLLTALARNYRLLHDLASDGRIAVLRASPLDPALYAAVAALPDFASTTSLVHLSDEVDQLQRRALFAAARRRLRLASADARATTATRAAAVAASPAIPASPAVPEIGDRGDFARFLADRFASLDAACGGRTPVCVEAGAARGFILAAHPGWPRHAAADLYLDLDLDHLALHFFQDDSGDLALDAGRSPGWQGAARLRAVALALYGAAVREDIPRAQAGLAALLAASEATGPIGPADYADLAGPIDPIDPLFTAFWVAEVAEALLALGASTDTAELAAPIAALTRRLDATCRALAAAAVATTPSAGSDTSGTASGSDASGLCGLSGESSGSDPSSESSGSDAASVSRVSDASAGSSGSDAPGVSDTSSVSRASGESSGSGAPGAPNVSGPPSATGRVGTSGALEPLLWAHAMAAAGAVLDDEALRLQAGRYAEIALRRQGAGGWLAGDAASGLAAHAEALRRLVAYGRLAPAAAISAAIRAATPALAQPLGASGELALPAVPAASPDSYLAYAGDPGTAYQNAYLAFLFHGLATGDLESARTALRLFHFPGRPRPHDRRAA